VSKSFLGERDEDAPLFSYTKYFSFIKRGSGDSCRQAPDRWRKEKPKQKDFEYYRHMFRHNSVPKQYVKANLNKDAETDVNDLITPKYEVTSKSKSSCLLTINQFTNVLDLEDNRKNDDILNPERKTDSTLNNLDLKNMKGLEFLKRKIKSKTRHNFDSITQQL
jgi:hypothetical protein